MRDTPIRTTEGSRHCGTTAEFHATDLASASLPPEFDTHLYRYQVRVARALLSSACGDLAGLLREVAADLAALGVPVDGAVSDGQHSIRLAIARVWPDVPHQLCHFHYLREAALPIFEADRHAKKELKKTVRGVRPVVDHHDVLLDRAVREDDDREQHPRLDLREMRALDHDGIGLRPDDQRRVRWELLVRNMKGTLLH